MTLLQKAVDLFLNIFYPKFCISCGKYGDYVCYECANQVEYVKTSVCQVCGRITKNYKFCPECRKNKKLFMQGMIIAANYDLGPVREIIHHLKYSGIAELSDVAGEMISESLMGSNINFEEFVVVPVPLFAKKESIRGYNQAELLARYVSDRLKLEGGLAIRRVRDTRTQVNLNRKQRMENLLGAFSCNDPGLVEGRNVLLIDDVMTTGSTLNECAKVLKESGAKTIYGAVVAKRI